MGRHAEPSRVWQPRDRVRIVAPAGPARLEDVAEALAFFSARYDVVPLSGQLTVAGYLAGDDARRAAELQAALDEPHGRAIIALRGGYGTTRILDRLDFSGFVGSPKWFVGSSDLTALLVTIWDRHRIPAIHGPMLASFGKVGMRDFELVVDLLEGRPWTAPVGLTTVCEGQACGPFIGGNLTLLAHLCGVLDPSYADGAVLFLEDVGEQTYRIDRLVGQLRRAGVLSRVAGIVLGAFTDCAPGPDGVGVAEMLAQTLAPLGVPVAAGYPAAHGTRNHPFIHGAQVLLAAHRDGIASLAAASRS